MQRRCVSNHNDWCIGAYILIWCRVALRWHSAADAASHMSRAIHPSIHPFIHPSIHPVSPSLSLSLLLPLLLRDHRQHCHGQYKVIRRFLVRACHGNRLGWLRVNSGCVIIGAAFIIIAMITSIWRWSGWCLTGGDRERLRGMWCSWRQS